MNFARFLAAALLLVGCTFTIHAESVVILSDAGAYFYGMDDAGDLVFDLAQFNSRCGNVSNGSCYETIGGVGSPSYSASVPTLNYDFLGCTYPQPGVAPCVVSDNGWTAAIEEMPGGLEEGIYGNYGSNPSQLLEAGFFDSIAINGAGEIVFDNGFLDAWYETSIPAVTTPEPSTIVLLGTGLLSLAGIARRNFLHS